MRAYTSHRLSKLAGNGTRILERVREKTEERKEKDSMRTFPQSQPRRSHPISRSPGPCTQITMHGLFLSLTFPLLSARGSKSWRTIWYKRLNADAWSPSSTRGNMISGTNLIQNSSGHALWGRSHPTAHNWVAQRPRAGVPTVLGIQACPTFKSLFHPPLTSGIAFTGRK